MTKLFGYYWAPVDDDPARQVALIAETGANAVYVQGRSLGRVPIAALQDHGIRLIADWSVFVGEELRRLFPDSVPMDAAGQPFDRDDWYVPVCPNHPQVRAWHRDEIARLLDDHGPQLFGLWLDFIRFPVKWEGAAPELRPLCFCRHCLNLFLGERQASYSAAETHAQARAILAERFDEWVSWKCGCIEAFTHEVRDLIDARGLDARLGIFSLPWRQGDLDGAIRSVAGQDLGRLAGQVDIFSPMVYHRLCGQDVAWIADVTRAARAWSARPALPIVQAMDRPQSLPPHELANAVAAALSAGDQGAMVFTLGDVQNSEQKVAALKRCFLAARGT